CVDRLGTPRARGDAMNDIRFDPNRNETITSGATAESYPRPTTHDQRLARIRAALAPHPQALQDFEDELRDGGFERSAVGHIINRIADFNADPKNRKHRIYFQTFSHSDQVIDLADLERRLAANDERLRKNPNAQLTQVAWARGGAELNTS